MAGAQPRQQLKQERKWEVESAVRTLREFTALAADRELFAKAKKELAKENRIASEQLGIGK